MKKLTNPWLEHVKVVRENNPDLPFKEAMKLASETYTKKKVVSIVSEVTEPEVTEPEVTENIESEVPETQEENIN